MSEATMIQLVATALFVGVPMVVAALLERLCRRTPKATLQRAFWVLLAAAGLGIMALALVRPMIGAAAMKSVGPIGGAMVLVLFVLSLAVARVARQR